MRVPSVAGAHGRWAPATSTEHDKTYREPDHEPGFAESVVVAKVVDVEPPPRPVSKTRARRKDTRNDGNA